MLIMSMDGLLLPMDGHSMLVMSATSTSANGWSFYARHVSDFGFKGYLGVVLLASCSVYFGYKECVPVVGLHFPSECVPSLHWSPFAMYSVE